MGAADGGRRRRRMEEDEEYVLEEEEEENEEDEYAEELSASSGGGEEDGEGPDAVREEDAEGDEDDAPRPKRRRNLTAGRPRQRRYEDDDDYIVEEPEEDDEADDYHEDLDEEVDGYHEDLDEEEEEEEAPKRVPKCGGRFLKRKLPQAAAKGSNQRRHEEDMDFCPDLDEEEEEDMDFDPEVDGDDEEFENEEDEETGVSQPRKVRVKNTVRRKHGSKQPHRKKMNSSSKLVRQKVNSAKSRKVPNARRRRRRSVMDNYEEDDDFIVDDQTEVNQRSRKKAKVGRQIETDHPTPIVEENIWPIVESDTSDFDFVTSDEEDEDVEPVVVEPARLIVRKRRKMRTYKSESSDSEFHVSGKELGDFRESEPLMAQPMLAASPRMISVTRNGEDKGKEKKEPEEAGRPTCGICLSEEQKITLQGVLNCCSHYFCFACIMEWSRVESRCPLCKRRFTTITKSSKMDPDLELIKPVIRVEERDQVYQPTEDEIRRWLDPYENVVCIECNQGGDDSLMLLCDICDSPAHTYCVGLGREVPDGSWYCGGCRVSGDGPSYHRNPVNSNPEEFVTFEGLPSNNPRQTFQGIDLNVSPRESPGINHLAESQASTVGISTPTGRFAANSGRRQMNEWISMLLSRPRPTTTSAAEVVHSGVPQSGSVPRTELSQRSFHALPEANTSQHSTVPRTESNHGNFEAAPEANTSHTLARRRLMNEWISTLLSRPRPTTISAEVVHSGVPHSGSVPRTELSQRRFHALSEANTSQYSTVPRTEPNNGNSNASDTLARRRRMNEWISMLLSRPRPMTISAAAVHSGVHNIGSVPRTEPNRSNFCGLLESNTSQLCDPIPRTGPNHRSFEATPDGNTTQVISTRGAELSPRFQINECLDILQSRPWSTNSPDLDNNGVQISGSVPGTESNYRNFHAPSESTSQTLLDQHGGFHLVQAQSNFSPCISVDGNNFQQTEGVKSNV